MFHQTPLQFSKTTVEPLNVKIKWHDSNQLEQKEEDTNSVQTVVLIWLCFDTLDKWSND